jgi:cysteine desulfuration protein SufE
VSAAALPPRVQDVVDEFTSLSREERLEALLDYAEAVPPLPPELRRPRALERVHECQTPFFVATRLDGDLVHLYFDAPDEAPTTRGFAGILSACLEGATLREVLETPDDFYTRMGLGEAISPLRLRGMGAILARLKRQLRSASGG